jgi:hypothetical protein
MSALALRAKALGLPAGTGLSLLPLPSAVSVTNREGTVSLLRGLTLQGRF